MSILQTKKIYPGNLGLVRSSCCFSPETSWNAKEKNSFNFQSGHLTSFSPCLSLNTIKSDNRTYGRNCLIPKDLDVFPAFCSIPCLFHLRRREQFWWSLYAIRPSLMEHSCIEGSASSINDQMRHQRVWIRCQTLEIGTRKPYYRQFGLKFKESLSVKEHQMGSHGSRYKFDDFEISASFPHLQFHCYSIEGKHWFQLLVELESVQHMAHPTLLGKLLGSQPPAPKSMLIPLGFVPSHRTGISGSAPVNGISAIIIASQALVLTFVHANETWTDYHYNNVSIKKPSKSPEEWQNNLHEGFPPSIHYRMSNSKVMLDGSSAFFVPCGNWTCFRVAVSVFIIWQLAIQA